MMKYILSITVCVLLSVVVSCRANPTGRIVGGVDATDGQFPHQISLRRNGSHTCGGSIISRNFILTAAHCVGAEDANGIYNTYPAKYFNIRAGSNDRLKGGVIIQVVEILTHEDYGNFLNDVALLRLEQSLIYSDKIQPIKLATAEVPAGQPVVISGWGRLTHNGDLPTKLQWNTLIAITRSECKARIKFDSDALICLDHQRDNGACNGDSGGPAVYMNEVVGIAGFVYGGCGNINPDGYAKVYYHVDWIKKHSDL